MHHPPHNPLQALLPRATDGCVQCSDTPVCYCSADEICVLTAKTCDQCPKFTCEKNETNSGSGSKGVSGGAVAGAVVGSLVLLAMVVLVFLWHRRRVRAANEAGTVAGPKEVPANAADVLNRPDPNEKAQQQPPSELENTIRMYDSSHTDINLDPEAQLQAAQGQLQPPMRNNLDNPFSDAQSIQTTSTGSQSTNVIPIALVPRAPAQGAHSVSTRSSSPSRPERSPGLDLNLAHLNVSKDSMPANYAGSDRSGASNALRNSYLSTATGATDFLNEAPIIVTPTHRQVLGVAKPEVVNAPGSAPSSVPGSPTGGDGLKVQLASRPSIRSPLATTSFGPSDVVKEEGSEESRGNPFGDEHIPIPAVPAVPSWATENQKDRPVSMATMATNAGTIIADIGSATRVQLGFVGQSAASSPMHSPATQPRLLQRMASGRLVAPRSGPNSGPQQPGTLQEQQERALAHAQEKAREQGLDLHRRISGSSVVSAASTRADSILESFPFVPPSPISSLPTRSPSTRSPLGREARSPSTEPDSPTRRAVLAPLPPSPAPLDPPDRRVLGLSTGSQLSTASSGLGAFDFQVETLPAPPTSFRGGLPKQRASLDTLALTQDLSSYPLGFEQRRPGPGEP